MKATISKEQHQQIINILLRRFKGLNERQIKTLCFVAYCDLVAKSYVLEDFRKSITKTSKDELLDDLRKLRDHDLANVFEHMGFAYVLSAEVNRKYEILLLYYLVTEHSDWLKQFKKVSDISYDVEFLTTVIENIKNGRDYNTPWYYRYEPEYIDSEMYSCLIELRATRVLSVLVAPEMMSRFFMETIEHFQLTDGFDMGLLDMLDEMAARDRSSHKEELAEAMAYVHYCLDGREVTITKPVSYWGYFLQGIQAAIRHEYEDGAKAFYNALRLYNKDMIREKNFFLMTLPSYYSIICFGRSKSAKDKERVATQYKKVGRYFRESTIPTAVLSRYYLNIDFQSYFEVAKQQEVKYLSNLMLRHLMSYLNIAKRPIMTKLRHQLVNHELRNILQLDEPQCAHLDELYGGGPVLSAERSLESWEVTLNDVLSKAGKDSAEEMSGETTRIVYTVYCSNQGYAHIAIQSQNVLKSGKWSVLHDLSFNQFLTLVNNIGDKHDQEAAQMAKRYGCSMNYRCETMMPALIGCNRVFTVISGNLMPVVVDEEKPYILLTADKTGRYRFTSNLSTWVLDHNMGNTAVVQRSKTHFTVIRYTPDQKYVYRELLEIGSMPPSAEKKLSRFMNEIKPELGVQSTAVDGGETLKAIDGDPQLTIRAYPSKALTFAIDVTLKASKGCKESYTAGHGQAIVVDEIDGERCQISRKLNREKELWQSFKHYLEDLTGDDDTRELTGQQMLDMIDYIKDMPEYCLEWPNGEEIHLNSVSDNDYAIKLRKAGRWFEVEGDVRINANTVLSMARLLEAISSSDGGKYVKLDDSNYLLVSESLRRQLERLNAMSTTERGTVKVSPLQAAVGDSIFGDNGAITTDSEWQKLRGKIVDSYNKRPRIPSALMAELRDYQLEGYQWMKRLTDWGGGACLADDMGLGKTVQAIAYLISEAKAGAALVVAPASVVSNWRNELARFAPSLNVVALNNISNRAAQIKEAGKNDVVLTTYGLLISEEEALTKKRWATVCLDEAHTIKNRDTKMSKVAMELEAKNRLALTGTPIQNHLGELWNLFQFLNPGLLGSHEQFQKKFITPIENDGSRSMQQQLKRIIGPFMLRRTKKEVVDELPDKTEIRISVDLTDEETAIYETLRSRAEKQLKESERVDVNVLAQITQLRQAACSPQLVNGDFEGESSKLNAFVTLVEEIAAGGNKILVFSQFTSFLKLAKAALDRQKIKYLYFDGATTLSKREKIIQQFRDDDDCQLFLISLKAGGLGLNLTEANYVIHLDPWWNPAIEQQATDRAYRIGQKQKVTVYHLISSHTIEEKILRLHATKRDLADQLLEGNSLSHKLTAADLLDILAGN
jgi:superfamily II DNA or RNA helicase